MNYEGLSFTFTALGTHLLHQSMLCCYEIVQPNGTFQQCLELTGHCCYQVSSAKDVLPAAAEKFQPAKVNDGALLHHLSPSSPSLLHHRLVRCSHCQEQGQTVGIIRPSEKGPKHMPQKNQFPPEFSWPQLNFCTSLVNILHIPTQDCTALPYASPLIINVC